MGTIIIKKKMGCEESVVVVDDDLNPMLSSSLKMPQSRKWLLLRKRLKSSRSLKTDYASSSLKQSKDDESPLLIIVLLSLSSAAYRASKVGTYYNNRFISKKK